MKKLASNKDNRVSPKQLFDFFIKHAKIEQDKLENQKKVMDGKLAKATEGKNIVISNYSKSDVTKLRK